MSISDRIAKFKHYYAWRMNRTCFQPHSTKTFSRTPYIIRREADSVGLFSYFITILGGIAYADRKGLIPVVDMKNYPNAYLYPSELGRVNAWEYYFEQPGGLALDNALSCRRYILGKDAACFAWPPQSAEFFCGLDGKLEYWRALCRKYIRFTPAVLERLGHLRQKADGRRVLGVLVRGTDYAALKPKGHPIPPTAEQAIAKTREALQEEGFDAVYLATEDKVILAKFQDAFGDKLLLPEADYLDYDYGNPKYLPDIQSSRANDKYLRGLEYLVSVLFLSKCPGFITSPTSGSAGVVCLSEGFKYIYVFDLGLYP